MIKNISGWIAVDQQNTMLNKLYITSIAVTKPIPENDYIANLPAVRNLRAMDALSFHKPVTFSLARTAPEQMIRDLEIGEPSNAGQMASLPDEAASR